MTLPLIFSTLFLLVNSVSAADSDSIWLSSNEGFIPGNEFSLNEKGPELSEPTSPLSLISLLSDGSDLLFENPESTNLFLSDSFDLVANESFDLAGCSSSNVSPIVRKSQVRRRDGPSVCHNPDPTPPGSDPSFKGLGNFEKFLPNLEKSFDLDASREIPKHNSICSLITANVLPWGVCSSGDRLDVRPAYKQEPDPSLLGLLMFFVDYCTLAPGELVICPGVGQEFYCCQYFDEAKDGNYGYGEYCVLLSALQCTQYVQFDRSYFAAENLFVGVKSSKSRSEHQQQLATLKLWPFPFGIGLAAMVVADGGREKACRQSDPSPSQVQHQSTKAVPGLVIAGSDCQLGHVTSHVMLTVRWAFKEHLWNSIGGKLWQLASGSPAAFAAMFYSHSHPYLFPVPTSTTPHEVLAWNAMQGMEFGPTTPSYLHGHDAVFVALPSRQHCPRTKIV